MTPLRVRTIASVLSQDTVQTVDRTGIIRTAASQLPSVMNSVATSYFVGVDVGTGSVRAALVSAAGQIIGKHELAIRTWNPQPDHYEQSSEDIWQAVGRCVQAVTVGTPVDRITGIGFDATCSLVALDAANQPCSLSSTGSNEQNVILWMDHRAAVEVGRINATAHPILNYVGGAVSLEMQTPKLLWCKQHIPTQYDRARHFFDLPDYLTWRSTADRTRSLCSTVCKWNYDATAEQWPADFYATIGLGDLMANAGDAIGSTVVAPGAALAGGLSAEAAVHLGLRPGTAVGASMIDAHAGALAMFGCRAAGLADTADMETKMAIICGTSSCHMSVTRRAQLTPGIWGPYRGALFADMHLQEAGQSATGHLLDHICQTHPANGELMRLAEAAGLHRHVYLNGHLAEMAGRPGTAGRVHELTGDVHLWPDYHGNRSPLADATLRGSICGLSLADDLDNLAVMYLAFVQALAYGTRHILETLASNGRRPFETLHIGGGLSKNALFVRTHADVCQLPVLLAAQSEVVLMGASMLGACAAGEYATLQQATQAMAGQADIVAADTATKRYHDRKYAVFLRMLADQRAYVDMMKE